MAPGPNFVIDSTRKEYSRIYPENDGEEIVISGISGRFPDSRNVNEFESNLYNKVDMVQSSDGVFGCITEFEIPKRIGKVRDLNKFDSKFFGVHNEQTKVMDPQCRILIEAAYEAILDSGINPKNIRGSKTSVIISTSYADMEKVIFYGSENPDGNFGMTGCSRAMLANRISFCLGLNGPSYLVDNAGSVQALNVAYDLLRSGSINAALIGGCNLILLPQIETQFKNMGVISSDGFTRPFDKNSSGYNRSEAMCCIFLQKKRDAKRVYGHIVHCKTNNEGYRPDGITHYSSVMKEQLLHEFYKDVNINPENVCYIEANGSSIPNDDIDECKLIDKIFSGNRKKPLLIGSVKSNMGFSEAASGVSALTKICLAFQNDKIAPNINFTEPRHEISSLIEGRLKVVSAVEDLPTPYIALNSFSLYGSNCHTLLRAFEKEKHNFGMPQDDLPRLVNWSGRTKSACNTVFDFINSRPLDSELIGMIHQIQNDGIPNVVFRGYGLFQSDMNGNTECIGRNVKHYSGIKPPIVWVFSGMGSQWTSMGSSLLKIPVIYKSIRRCHNVLKPKGLNLIDILTSSDKTTYDNILHSFVGIAAIQIALVDFLKFLGLTPDFIVGHSVGELGCGYADNGFTLEQMILCAYFRGKVSLESKKILGSMAAVGMGYKSIVKILPSSIEVACHNSFESCTISGPAEDISKFVEELKSRNVFAKEVPCSNIAYHSRYISHFGPQLMKYLKETIPNPKLRSKKWLSTSVSQNNLDHHHSQYCSAEYHTNNLLNSVLFEETIAMLPTECLTIEIAPHGLLQAILKRSMTKSVHVDLTQRGKINNHEHLMQALGKMYMNGVEMKIDRIYPKIEFPVSRGTPNLSSLISWDHTDNWSTISFEDIKLDNSSERTVDINIREDNFKFLKDHIINGNVIIPASYLLQFVVDSFAAIKSKQITEMSIQFTDLKFLRHLLLNENETVHLNVMIQRGTGYFSISESAEEISSGYIKELEEPYQISKVFKQQLSHCNDLSSTDFYKELRIRRYDYGKYFKGVEKFKCDNTFSQIECKNNNLIALLECLFQINYFSIDTRLALYPKSIQKLTILEHNSNLVSSYKKISATFNKITNTIATSGIEIVGLTTTTIETKESSSNLILKCNRFISHFPSPILTINDAVSCCLQLAVENSAKPRMKIVELKSNKRDPLIAHFPLAINNLPLVTGKCILLSKLKTEIADIEIKNCDLSNISNCTFIILENASSNLHLVIEASKSLRETSFLISRENRSCNEAYPKPIPSFNTIAILRTENENLILHQKIKNKIREQSIAIKISDGDLSWLKNVQNAVMNGPVILYSENEQSNGILGICNGLKSQCNVELITFVIINDVDAPCFELNNKYYADQIKLEQPINILKDGKWGSYRQLSLHVSSDLDSNFQHVICDIAHPGDLETISWYQGNLQRNKLDVKVSYAALNFQDVLYATGKIPNNLTNKHRLNQKYKLGMEFSGIDLKNNARIIGITTGQGLSSYINLKKSRMIWNVPDNWSLKDAATIPIAYTVVYYAFFQVAPIKKGKTILIHCGAGGIGLAAIRVALAYGLKVFTTVSNWQKKMFLMKSFPQLKENQIGNSRDTSFEEMIQEHTNNKGVDYILNTLSGEAMLATLRCLGKNGHFIELGKVDLINDKKMGIGVFLKEISYHVLSLDRFIEFENDIKILYIRDKIEYDIANGIIQPLHSTVFKSNKVVDGFRYFMSGQHIGKILIEVAEEHARSINPVKLISQIYFDPNMVYIVNGSLSELELEFVDWLIVRGARKINLNSLKKITQSYTHYKIGIWKSYGANIILSTNNVTKRHETESLILNATASLGSVAGIFNFTNIYKSDTLKTESLKNMISLKIDATRYLDELSRKLCPNLKHFLVMSTLVCPSDNGAMALNSMANSAIEKIIENRVTQSYPGQALIWGNLKDYSNELVVKEVITPNGIQKQEIFSCLNVLDKIFMSSEISVSCSIVDKKINKYYSNFIERISHIIGIKEIESINQATSLSDLGLNSLTALEISYFLQYHCELQMTIKEISLLTFKKLNDILHQCNEENKEEMILEMTNDDSALGISAIVNQFDINQSVTANMLNDLESNSLDKASQLIFIPNLGGSFKTLNNDLVLKLHSNVKVLQMNESMIGNSIADIAQSVVNLIRGTLKKGEKFYLVGYSFGALLTLELASLLEKFKYSGSILLIDGAPHFLNELVYQNLGKNYTDDDLYDEIFATIAKQTGCSKKSPYQFKSELRLKTFEQKINKFIDLVKDYSTFTKENVEQMIKILFNRIKMIESFWENETNKLTSSITLIRPIDVSIEDIEEDYKLSKLTKGKVIVHYINGNHIDMLKEPKLANLINYFDPAKDEKKKFENFLYSNCILEKDFV